MVIWVWYRRQELGLMEAKSAPGTNTPDRFCALVFCSLSFAGVTQW